MTVYDGPHEFSAQPLHGLAPLLDGTRLNSSFAFVETEVGGGAVVFEKRSGKRDIQVRLSDTALPINFQAKQWEFEQQASSESEWNLIREMSAGVRSVYFVPYTTVTDEWILAAGTNNLTLSRDRAESAVATFESVLYTSSATLDGVTQTIVETTPSTGEVQLTGNRSVVVTGASGGERLVVRYYAAFVVVAVIEGEELQDFNLKVRQVRLLEVSPS